MVSYMTESDGPRFDPQGPKLVYVQIADDIGRQIDRGVYVPGGRIPALDALAEEYGAARMTIRRAVRELRERGRVEVVPGKGTYVIS